MARIKIEASDAQIDQLIAEVDQINDRELVRRRDYSDFLLRISPAVAKLKSLNYSAEQMATTLKEIVETKINAGAEQPMQVEISVGLIKSVLRLIREREEAKKSVDAEDEGDDAKEA